MKVLTKKLPRDHNLFLFGDDHEGTILRHNDGWRQLIEMMESEYDGLSPDHNFGLHHGDLIDAICIDDPRYDGLTTDGKILQQIQQSIRHLTPIKDKLIGICDGNHPRKLWRFGGITEHICNELGVPFLTWSAIIEYQHRNGKPIYRHYCAHGFTAVNSRIDDPVDRRNSMKRALRRQLQAKADNCILMTIGHIHRLLIYAPEPPVGIVNGTDTVKQAYPIADQTAAHIPPYLRWYAACGCFFRIYADGMSSYVEVAGYDPTEPGFCIARCRDGKFIDVKPVFL